MKVIKLIEEANRNIKFMRGDFYTVDDINQFLKEQGYNWTRRASKNKRDREVAFSKVYNDCKNLDKQLILVGTEADWGDIVDEYYICEDITQTNFIKYIQQPSLTEFRVYSVLERQYDEELNLGSLNIDYRLEKDLSLEWVKFLVKHYPEYSDYLLKNCGVLMGQEKGRKENNSRIIARKVADLQQDKDMMAKTDKKIQHYQDVIEAVNQTKNDLQV